MKAKGSAKVNRLVVVSLGQLTVLLQGEIAPQNCALIWQRVPPGLCTCRLPLAPSPPGRHGLDLRISPVTPGRQVSTARRTQQVLNRRPWGAVALLARADRAQLRTSAPPLGHRSTLTSSLRAARPRRPGVAECVPSVLSTGRPRECAGRRT